VWHSGLGESISFQVSADGGDTWTDAAGIPGVLGRPENAPPYDRYDMITDGTGVVHLLAVGRPATGMDPTAVYHVRWDGKGWLEPDIIFDGPGFPEFLSVTTEGGNWLHAVWFTREKLWGASEWNVWHSKARIGAPARTPIPLQVSTPTETPTASPEPTPTLTRTPLPNPAVGEMNWRRNATFPLVAAFLSTVVLVSTIFVTKQMRGR
jgi:hypothetical protein